MKRSSLLFAAAALLSVLVLAPGRAAALEVVREDVAPRPSARLLDRGDRAVVDPAGPVRVERDTDVDALLAWTGGKLSFRGAPFREVAPELERWFNLRIEVRDPALGDRRLTAEFEDESVDVVLQTIADLIRARVSREEQQMVFSL